jgi:hypothetical protein
MSNHADEYQALLAVTAGRDRDAIVAHYELGQLFARYGETVPDIAEAIGRSVTYVADHIRIARDVVSREHLDNVLDGRDDIDTWTVLLAWVKAGGPGQNSDDEPDAKDIARQRRNTPRGNQFFVPPVIVKSLADLGLNAREVLTDFWGNASAQLILNIAYPGQVPESVRKSIAEAEGRMAAEGDLVA